MNAGLTVLVIEDDPSLRLGCVQAAGLAGMEAVGFDTAEDALRIVRPGFPGIIVTDLRLPGMDGLTVVRRCAELDADLPVIVITGHGNVAVAVEAMRCGAYDFITKPFGPDRLTGVMQRALEKRKLTLEVSDLRQRLARLEGVEGKLIGDSAQIRKVRSLIVDIADFERRCPAPGRDRGGQGTGGALAAPALPPQECPARRGQLCGHFRGPARQRVVRP